MAQMAIEKRLKRLLHNSGYINPIKLADSLQGSVWRAIDKSMDRTVVIKATKKNLHENGIVLINGVRIDVEENIIKESSILKYLTESKYGQDKYQQKACPKSFVKYIDFFQTYVNQIYIALILDFHMKHIQNTRPLSKVNRLLSFNI